MPRISKGVQNFQSIANSLRQQAESGDRNVTKKEVAVALFEMVKNDKLSQADKKAALKLLDAGIPLTRGAEDLIEGFAEGEQDSLANVMLRGQAAVDDLPTQGSSNSAASRVRVYSSLGRLDEMVDLFTDRGNLKLDAGEIQALSGFYGGLKSSSRAKIKDRMVEIYQNATYSNGQQDAFRELLEMKGFSRAQLEGVSDTNSTSGFDGMSDAAKSDQLFETYYEHNDFSAQYSALRAVNGNNVATAARSRIDDYVDSWITQEQSDLDNSGEDDPSVWLGDMKVIHLVDDNGDPDLNSPIGIGVEVHSTFGNGGNTQGLMFDLGGSFLGSDYLAEE